MGKLCLKFDAHAVSLFPFVRPAGLSIRAFYSPRDSCAVIIARRPSARRSAIRNGTATTDRTNERTVAQTADRSIDRTHFGALRRNGSLSRPRKVASFVRGSLIPTSSIRSVAVVVVVVVSKDNCRRYRQRETGLKGLPPPPPSQSVRDFKPRPRHLHIWESGRAPSYAWTVALISRIRRRLE